MININKPPPGWVPVVSVNKRSELDFWVDRLNNEGYPTRVEKAAEQMGGRRCRTFVLLTNRAGINWLEYGTVNNSVQSCSKRREHMSEKKLSKTEGIDYRSCKWDAWGWETFHGLIGNYK